MRFAIVITLLLIIFAILEYQIITIQNGIRKKECAIIRTQTQIRIASDYEYYSCLAKE